jgi:hypothetical protein
MAGGLVLVGHLTGGHGLLAGLRADDGKHLILGDQFGRRCCGRFGLGFVVFDDQLDGVFFTADVQAASAVDVRDLHLGGAFGLGANVGDIARHRHVEPDLDRICPSATTTGERGNGFS